MRPALFKSAQCHFHLDNAPVHNSILVTDYLTKMGIKTVPQLSYSQDLAPCDFWLFPKLRRCCYETIEEMKEAVTMVIDTLIQGDFHGAFQELLERYNKCIASGGDYFEGDLSFICVLSIEMTIPKKSGNLFNDPRTIIQVLTATRQKNMGNWFESSASAAILPLSTSDGASLHENDRYNFCGNYLTRTVWNLLIISRENV